MVLLGRVLGVLLCSLPAACGAGGASTSKPGKPSLARAGGTGSFAVVPVGGAEKLYLPEYSSASGEPAIAVVDVSAVGDGGRGTPALLGEIELGAAPEGRVAYATTTAGDSTIVVAASTQSPTVWFIDPRTDQLIDELALGASYGQSTFRGDGGYVTSIALDPTRREAVLAVWNGFAIVDLTTRKIARILPAPPSENFALDTVHRRVIAPFYDCASSLSPSGEPPASCGTPRALDGTPMTDGLSVVDLDDDAVYTYESTDARDPHAPVGTLPGSAAIDPDTERTVVTSKGHQYQTIIDFSRAVFERAERRVTAPSNVLTGNGLTDVAIAPGGRLAFWEGENARDIAAGVLTTLAPSSRVPDAGADAGGGGEPEYVFGLMPSLPDGTEWMNAPSSHGIAVAASSTGAPFGITVSHDYRWVARVDLAALLALPDSYHEVADVSSAVTLLDAGTSR